MLVAEIQHAGELQTTDFAAATKLWAKVDRRISRDAPYVFLDDQRKLFLLSRRVGNFTFHPQWQVLLDQLWVH